jgi:hypothetical protein
MSKVKLPSDFANLIADSLSLAKKEVEETFDVSEDRQGFLIARLQPKKWLDQAQFKMLCALARDLGGDYVKEKRMWRVPGSMAKHEPSPTVAGTSPSLMSAPEPAPLDEASESDEYFIARSVGQIGYLYPVLKDAQGNVIDGVHRLSVDPKWPFRTVEEVKDATQLVIARLIANVCRRMVPKEEKTEWLRQIATLTGWTPKQIAENLPVSYNWVMKYIPDKFKERPGQGPMEYPVTRRVTELQKPVARLATQFIQCSRCGSATNEPVHLEGKFYCAACAEKQVAEKQARGTARGESREEPEQEPVERQAEERKLVQPEPVLTGFEVECPECHRKLLINHKRWPDGREEHEIEAET